MTESVHKIIITGTGRAGTTMMVRLFTELGMNTGFSVSNWQHSWDEHCQAGLEHSLSDPNSPYIIKNPAFCAELPVIIEHTSGLVIDHAIIPVRDLESATRSRIRIGGDGDVPGGLWLTNDPKQQKTILAESFHELLHCLTQHEIPFTLLDFPRFATDADYMWRKLQFLWGDITREEFDRAFALVARPKLIHRFNQADSQGVTDASIAARYRECQEQEERARAKQKRRRRLHRALNASLFLTAGLLAYAIACDYWS